MAGVGRIENLSPGGGRAKGVPNKITADVKRMVEQAVIRAGKNVQKKRRTLADLEPGSAYLADQAEKNPVAFMSLLGKILPRQIDVNVSVLNDQIVSSMKERRNLLAQRREELLIDADIIDATPAQEA